jgi:hypothetical protein
MFSEPLLAHPAEMAAFTPPGTRILGMMTNAINTTAAPTMKGIWFSMWRQYPPSHRL